MTTQEPDVLLTRPLADSRRLAEALRVPCLISPVLEVVQVGEPPIAEALLLTSSNAVDAWVAGGGATGLPVWCVGPRTAASAEAAGLRVQAVAADAEALVALVPRDAPPLVHARGAVVRGDLAEDLRARGLKVVEAVLYEAQPLGLSADARAACRSRPLVAPVYSPRSAALLVEAWPTEAIHHLRAIALSDAVAAVLPVAPVAISPSPDGAAMLETIRDAIAG